MWKRLALVALALTYHFLGSKYNVSYIYEEHEKFNAWPFWNKFFYIAITTQFAFSKYLFIWFNAEAAAILSGLGFERDKNGQVTWYPFLFFVFLFFFLFSFFFFFLFLFFSQKKGIVLT